MAEQKQREVDEQTRNLVEVAKAEATKLREEARAEVDKLITESRVEAERTRANTQREVDDLTRQRDSITGQLGQLRELLISLATPGAAQPEQVAQAAQIAEAAQAGSGPRPTPSPHVEGDGGDDSSHGEGSAHRPSPGLGGARPGAKPQPQHLRN